MDVDELVYTFDPAELGLGSLLGNRDVEAELDATTNLVSAWSAQDDLSFCGPARFAFTALQQARGTFVPEPLAALVTRFFPGHQETIFGTEGLILTLRAFVPIGTGYERAVGWLIEIQAEGPRLLQVDVDLRFAGAGQDPSHERLVRLGEDRGQLVGTSEPIHLRRFGLTLGSPNEVRVFGTPSGPPDQVVLGAPARARLTYRLLVEGTIAVPFILSYSPAGEQVAWSGFLALSDLERFAAQSARSLEQHLSTARVLTPEAPINRALAWASATSLRVQHTFAAGPAVAASPGSADVAVGTAAWYAIAADWLTPAFSDALLKTLATKAQTETGALASVLHGRTEGQETFDLDVSDATPLFILAVAHHGAAMGDSAFGEALWPAVRQAADALLAARSDDGLIHLNPEGTANWGLPGWRKQIPGYRLVGAVTELNVLAAWALFAAQQFALAAGDAAAHTRWQNAAGHLAAALPRFVRTVGELPRLSDEEEELTGDLVFPLLAGLAEEDLAARLAQRLTSRFQWTPAGARTVGSDQPSYDPAFASGLMGGISTLLTAWVGVAAREHRRELPADALRALAALSEPETPRVRDLVPGQLAAALHGESLTRLGAALHPLAAPLAHWLAIEGLLGLRLPMVPWIEAAELRPALPAEWHWLVVSRLPWQGSQASIILLDGIIHTDAGFRGAPIERWTSIEAVPAAPLPAWRLRRPGEVALFVASPDEPFRGPVHANGQRWAVDLGRGEAVLLRSSEAS
ncbi:MAG: hypothetical protein M5U01_16210 [Ardenticatenaceae bacterium]|nr:hypothetical protein [Ardenticatenaceae bacterium]